MGKLHSPPVGAQGAHDPLVTSSLFFECEEVLKRPEQREISGLSLADVDWVLGVRVVAIEPVAVHLRWPQQLRNPDDELVLEATVNAGSKAAVSLSSDSGY